MFKKGKNKRSTVQPVTQRSWLLWVVVAGVFLIVGGLSYILIVGVNGAETGTPKLVVDRTEVDEGYQKLGATVRTTFKLRNEGDGTLRVVDQPQVKAVEGC
ncbi:MAG: hypothetical protein DPW09_01430 [Anaerolineae bacterium]|nr:hypothetical protein [Anaerolineae bacterium]